MAYIRGRLLTEVDEISCSVERVGDVASKADRSPASVISISPECRCKGELILNMVYRSQTNMARNLQLLAHLLLNGGRISRKTSCVNLLSKRGRFLIIFIVSVRGARISSIL